MRIIACLLIVFAPTLFAALTADHDRDREGQAAQATAQEAEQQPAPERLRVPPLDDAKDEAPQRACPEGI